MLFCYRFKLKNIKFMMRFDNTGLMYKWILEGPDEQKWIFQFLAERLEVESLL